MSSLVRLSACAVLTAMSSGPSIAAEAPNVTPYGMLTDRPEWRSPNEQYSIRVDFSPSAATSGGIAADLTVTSVGGLQRCLPHIPGCAFFVSDAGDIVALETVDAKSVPGRLSVYDFEGQLRWTQTVHAPRNPSLSLDGSQFAVDDGDGLLLLDLFSGATVHLPAFDCFAVGADGLVVGTGTDDPRVLLLVGRHGPERLMELPSRVRAVKFSAAGENTLVLTAHELYQVPLERGPIERLYAARSGWDLRDLRVTQEQIVIGARRRIGDTSTGMAVALAANGVITAEDLGPSERVPTSSGLPHAREEIPWPLQPNAQHPVGNTYGEFQSYPYLPNYLHPGIDVLGDANQPVFAVRSGVVKAVLTTAGDLHWRVAVGDAPGPDPCSGYLYAHLSRASIAVSPGDTVAAGDYLGSLVSWPEGNFTHCHFARIAGSGETWDGLWLSVSNPHLELPQTESLHPVFEPARGNDLLAFCSNGTSLYQDPTLLQFQVDIIAHVSDRIASAWDCTVQELRYTIYPLGDPASPVVDNKLAAYFDLPLDYYAGGSNDSTLVSVLYQADSVCHSQGSYESREFYHILTNSDGDSVPEASDFAESWDTTLFPDQSWVVRVTAIDVAGNVSSDSMIVTTHNEGASVAPSPQNPSIRLLQVAPNPVGRSTELSFSLPAADLVSVHIFDAGGRLVYEEKFGWLSSGQHRIHWIGTDSAGRPVPAGRYFVQLQARSVGTLRSRFVMVR